VPNVSISRCRWWEAGAIRILFEVASLAGAVVRLPPVGQPELALTDADRDEAAKVVPPLPGERLVLLQPGATDPRRRWPARSFAVLADRLAHDGARIALNGSPDEASPARDVAACMRAPAIVLAGRLSLGACAACSRVLPCSFPMTRGRCTSAWPWACQVSGFFG